MENGTFPWVILLLVPANSPNGPISVWNQCEIHFPWAILNFLNNSRVTFFATKHFLSSMLPNWPIFCKNDHFGRLGLLTKSIFLLTDMMILWLLVWKLVQKIHWDQFLHTLLYYHHTQIRISEIPLYWGLYCKMPTFEPLIGSFWDSNHVELSQRRFQRCDRFGAGGFFKHKKYLSTSDSNILNAELRMDHWADW